MTATKPLSVPSEMELLELQVARKAFVDARAAALNAEIFKDAMEEVVKKRFRSYCYRLLPYFVLSGESFWLSGEFAGEYKMLDGRDLTSDGEWLNVRVIGYTKKGSPLASNKWTWRKFNPNYIATMALAENPNKDGKPLRAGAPP